MLLWMLQVPTVALCCPFRGRLHMPSTGHLAGVGCPAHSPSGSIGGPSPSEAGPECVT